ncbi:MAG: hypothetical protein U0103_19660 [Candidatus Obscuribacterales bacterium]
MALGSSGDDFLKNLAGIFIQASDLIVVFVMTPPQKLIRAPRESIEMARICIMCAMFIDYNSDNEHLDC